MCVPLTGTWGKVRMMIMADRGHNRAEWHGGPGPAVGAAMESYPCAPHPAQSHLPTRPICDSGCDSNFASQGFGVPVHFPDLRLVEGTLHSLRSSGVPGIYNPVISLPFPHFQANNGGGGCSDSGVSKVSGGLGVPTMDFSANNGGVLGIYPYFWSLRGVCQ